MLITIHYIHYIIHTGAEHMKLGFISRITPTNNTDHVILATQFFKPKELAIQINLNLNNIWGIIKYISELLLSKPDGKYALIKDPNKSTLRLYELPIGAFEERGEEGEEGAGGDSGGGREQGGAEGEDGDGEGEDGPMVVPDSAIE